MWRWCGAGREKEVSYCSASLSEVWAALSLSLRLLHSLFLCKKKRRQRSCEDWERLQIISSTLSNLREDYCINVKDDPNKWRLTLVLASQYVRCNCSFSLLFSLFCIDTLIKKDSYNNICSLNKKDSYKTYLTMALITKIQTFS